MKYVDEFKQVVEFAETVDGTVVTVRCLVNDERVTAFVEGGGVIEEAPVRIPNATPVQIRMALNRLSLRETVEAAVTSGSQDLKDTWEYSYTIERKNPEVVSLASALNLTEKEVDDIFILAASL